MPASFPWPQTEEETVAHLRQQHHLHVRSLREWWALFGGLRLPTAVHAAQHEGKDSIGGKHRHVEVRRQR